MLPRSRPSRDLARHRARPAATRRCRGSDGRARATEEGFERRQSRRLRSGQSLPQAISMSTMHSPPHPGETLRDDVLPALGLTVTEAARQLGVARAALSRVLNGKAAVSPEMALRLQRWLGVDRGGRAGMWLAMQSAHDLWLAERAAKAVLNKIEPALHTQVQATVSTKRQPEKAVTQSALAGLPVSSPAPPTPPTPPSPATNRPGTSARSAPSRPAPTPRTRRRRCRRSSCRGCCRR